MFRGDCGRLGLECGRHRVVPPVEVPEQVDRGDDLVLGDMPTELDEVVVDRGVRHRVRAPGEAAGCTLTLHLTPTHGRAAAGFGCRRS